MTQPEDDWADLGEVEPDLASKLAVAVMALPWTHGGTEDEHCYRYGELQELFSAILAEHKP